MSSTIRNRTSLIPIEHLSMGIINLENNIKIFYVNLLKIINKTLITLKEITGLNKNCIKKIISKLNYIKLIIEADMAISNVLIDDNKDEKNKKSSIVALNNIDPRIFYKDFVNILNFYITILMKEKDKDNLICEHYSNFLTKYYEMQPVYEVIIKDFLNKSNKYREESYKDFINESKSIIKSINKDFDNNYYQKLYDPKFNPTLKGGRHNKSNSLDMKYIKDLCKANQIKLSTTKNDMRSIYTKKELITKLKRKRII